MAVCPAIFVALLFKAKSVRTIHNPAFRVFPACLLLHASLQPCRNAGAKSHGCFLCLAEGCAIVVPGETAQGIR